MTIVFFIDSCLGMIQISCFADYNYTTIAGFSHSFMHNVLPYSSFAVSVSPPDYGPE
jgi:hypothetical protein